MKKPQAFTICVVLLLTFSFISVKLANAQWATNPSGTLFGENTGDFIVFQFAISETATEYIVYRSTSVTGPWEQIARIRQAAATTGGAKVDYTPDAKIKDLCYLVEAIDSTGAVIEIYQAICVPRYVPRNKN